MAGVGQTGYWRTGVWIEGDTDFGEFDFLAEAIIAFTGNAIVPDNTGAFGLVGTASLDMAWVPELGPPKGSVGIPGVPYSVGCIVGPGDAVTVSGVAGTVIRDTTGQLVVVDTSGQVLCIVGPGGVVLP